MSLIDPDDLDLPAVLTSAELAEFLRMKLPAFHKLRSRGYGPRATKISAKRIVFLRPHVLEWLQDQSERDKNAALPRPVTQENSTNRDKNGTVKKTKGQLIAESLRAERGRRWNGR